MLKWVAGIGGALLALLQIVTLQRNKARRDAEDAQHKADVSQAARESEQRIAEAQAKQREIAQKVQHEIDTNKGVRPTGDFGDSRLRNGKD